jgi:hypothetical protein
MPQYQDLPCGG